MFNGNISMKFYDMCHFVRSNGKKTVQRAHCAVGSHSRIFGGDFLYSWDTTVQFLVAIFSSVGSTVQFLVAIFSTVGSAVQYDTCELAGGGAP